MGQKHERATYGANDTKCNTYYPSYGSPRLVAGAPLTNDVMKCQLKPVDLNDYTVQLTGAEQDRLRSIFPEGVCDYTKSGEHQRKMKAQWLTF